MLKVTVLAFDNSLLSSVALPADILNAAGVFYNQLMGATTQPLFDLAIVTSGGQPVRCHQTTNIQANASFESIETTDLLIVSALMDLEALAAIPAECLEQIQKLQQQGTTLASICTGAFVLGKTGLLNGKRATTHWGAARQFNTLFPTVELQKEKTVVDEGKILTSGGATAAADLCLHLIRRFAGEQVAEETARALLLDPHRSEQSVYANGIVPGGHIDSKIRETETWLARNYNQEITIELLAYNCCLSRRTFERRFKKATGSSPLNYLQQLRIEQAKQLLARTASSFAEITNHVGYRDTSTFRRTFQRVIGLTPGQYRKKFNSAAQPVPVAAP